MKKKHIEIYLISLCTIFLVFSSPNLTVFGNDVNSNDEGGGYTHTVLVGVATSQNCAPCDYMNTFMYDLYNDHTYDFHYVDMIVYDHDGNVLNSWAKFWAKRYYVYKQPSLVFDGGYKIHIGYQSLDQILEKIEECGNRDVWDITADMTVLWMGNATIQIGISIKNNENEDYKFYLRIFVTERNSRYTTYFNQWYHYGFLDFVIFGNTITVSPGDTYITAEIWNGNEHEDGHGKDFGDIEKDNIKIIMGIYRGDAGSRCLDQTLAATADTGLMPYKPDRPSGRRNGKVGIEYKYKSRTTDPQGDYIYYLFDWGDGNKSGWLGPYASGNSVEESYLWTEKSNFEIKVKAKDTNGHESIWSDPLPISIPRARNKLLPNTFLLRLIERFPNAFLLLRQILGL